ncbi:hypothetical protein A0H81_00436 [Grifola frondosa]|uniref:Transmembrane protein n=1 Tax=Grifola frondosa TaxID=5627 RepID=A0A1C7MQT7_GRIFR|nr:hypothetical protein A0H81_00436 [Grifola frondosa]
MYSTLELLSSFSDVESGFLTTKFNVNGSALDTAGLVGLSAVLRNRALLFRAYTFAAWFLWANIFLSKAAGKVVDFLEQGFSSIGTRARLCRYRQQPNVTPSTLHGNVVPRKGMPSTRILWRRIIFKYIHREYLDLFMIPWAYATVERSTFIVPFVIPAGNGLTFDWVVPFIPGTQYQICMFSSNGVSGGCQATYTVYQAPNHTLVDPPVAPSLHPPYNISSDTMDAINWTVSLSYGMPFYVSLVDSTGLGWANGPLHSGAGGSTDCLALDASPSKKQISPGTAIGSGIGGLVLGLILGLLGTLLFQRLRRRSGRRSRNMVHERKFSASPMLSGQFHDLPSSSAAEFPPGVQRPSRDPAMHIEPFVLPSEREQERDLSETALSPITNASSSVSDAWSRTPSQSLSVGTGDATVQLSPATVSDFQLSPSGAGGSRTNAIPVPSSPPESRHPGSQVWSSCRPSTRTHPGVLEALHLHYSRDDNQEQSLQKLHGEVQVEDEAADLRGPGYEPFHDHPYSYPARDMTLIFASLSMYRRTDDLFQGNLLPISS